MNVRKRKKYNYKFRVYAHRSATEFVKIATGYQSSNVRIVDTKTDMMVENEIREWLMSGGGLSKDRLERCSIDIIGIWFT